MQATAVATEIKAFAAGVGPKSYISVSVGKGEYGDMRPSCAVYPSGIGRGDSFRGSGETWEEAIADARAKWSENADSFLSQLIQKMALAVITITATTGECTDAGLRLHGFDQLDIDCHGERAAERANDMAATGPFSIRRIACANEAA